MQQRVSLITLGVADVDRARRFYEAMGWTDGKEVQDTVFFQAGPLVVTLWSRTKLAADCGMDDRWTGGFGGIALAYNVDSPTEVDRLIDKARTNGATITKPPEQTFYGGYAGVFADPDGHTWEIAHNPGFTLNEDGSIVLPDFDSTT